MKKGIKSLREIDLRLQVRRDLFLSRMVEKRTCVIHQLSTGWDEEMSMWRFLKNGRFSWEVLSNDCLKDISAKVSGRHVLSIQDGSTISLCGYLNKRQGFGKMGSRGDHPGIVLHPSVVLDAQNGTCLGLAAIQLHDGQQSFTASHDQMQDRRKVESKEKKTGIWLSCGKAARERLQTACGITHIADREADFFEMLLEFGQHKVQNENFIIRVNKDRQLGHRAEVGRAPYKGQPDIYVHSALHDSPIQIKHRCVMSKLVEKMPVQATIKVNLAQTHKRKKRTAIMEVRFAQQIPLCRPLKITGRIYEGQPIPGSVNVALVEAREITPDLPKGENPVCWRLYTSHPVNSLQDALQIIKWYAWRWKIELLFAVVKSSGLDVEHAPIEHAERFKKLAILAIMAAVQVIQLLQARDGHTDQLITDVFDEQDILLLKQINSKLQGKTLLLKNPYPPHSLAFAVWIIARLGSWKGYKSHRPPGIKTISRGLHVFYQIKKAADFLSG